MLLRKAWLCIKYSGRAVPWFVVAFTNSSKDLPQPASVPGAIGKSDHAESAGFVWRCLCWQTGRFLLHSGETCSQLALKMVVNLTGAARQKHANPFSA